MALATLDSVKLKWNNYIVQKPTPKQLAFLLLMTEEGFYGGAAGGGKSSALLMAALQYADVPGYAALILRRTYSELSMAGALMDRAQAWLAATDAKFNSETKTWRFPSGATLTFGFLENDPDKYRYQSSEFQYIGFDELTEFQESQYRYLFSRLRKLETASVPLRMRAASNPGGVGHDWVKQRFIVEGEKYGRPFIPAKIDDNPYLNRAEYRKALNNLDLLTREQLLNGDWSIKNAGTKFRREWFEIVDELPMAMNMVRYWDIASTEPKPGTDPDYTCGCLMGKSKDGIYYIADVMRLRATPLVVEKIIKQRAQMDGISTLVYIEQEPGSSGVNTIDHYRRVVLPEYAFYGDRVTGNKSDRANPLSSQAQAGNVKLVKGNWIGAFFDEIEMFPEGSHDDQVDSASGAFSKIAGHRDYGFSFAGEERKEVFSLVGEDEDD